MKKISNKYRNNNSSNGAIYSLNYKFDSNSIAGKISGTALDLIKRYNDFAKDAQGNNDYVSAEIFRQYAEHYRKIVTEINERKNQQRAAAALEMAENQETSAEESQESATAEQSVEAVSEKSESMESKSEARENIKKEPKRSFKIIEISHVKADEAKSESSSSASETKAEVVDVTAEVTKPKRVYRRRSVAAEPVAETVNS